MSHIYVYIKTGCSELVQVLPARKVLLSLRVDQAESFLQLTVLDTVTENAYLGSDELHARREEVDLVVAV